MTNILSISDVRKNLPYLVDKVEKRDDRVIITVNGRGKVAMISLEELESIEETAKILAIPGASESIKRGIKDIKKGRLIPLDKLR